MKIRPFCAACILTRRAIEIEEFTPSKNPDEMLSLYRSILETASLYMGPDIEAALLATMTFRRLKNLLNNDDPYANHKREAFKKAVERALGIRDAINEVKEDKEKLKLAIKASTIASALVDRIWSPVSLREPPHLNDLMAIKLSRDDSLAFHTFLENRIKTEASLNIVYVTSTTVELPYDYILIDILREKYNAFVNIVVRKGSYEDFASLDDAEWNKLRDHADRILLLEADLASIVPDDVPRQVFESLEAADIAIVKGCLNSLSWKNLELEKPWLALFYSSCPIISMQFGVAPKTFNAVFHTP